MPVSSVEKSTELVTAFYLRYMCCFPMLVCRLAYSLSDRSKLIQLVLAALGTLHQ